MTEKFSVSKDGFGFDRMVKLLFFEPVEKYPFFKNKSVFIHFSLFVSIFLLILSFCFLNLCFAQQTYNLEVVFKKSNWQPDTIRSYGNALSTAGDVNQDGYDDIVYSVFFDNWYGYGYVFFGGNPMDTIPDLILKCEGEGQPLMSICSGDVNGDSISDVIIGEGQAGNWGKVFVYFGGVGMDSLPDLTLNGEPLNAWPFGISVACGDINGDTFDDLIIGSYDNGDLDGRVYVYYGGALLDTLPDVIINGHNGEAFGTSVGSGGDVNSDDYEDIVVGADENSEAYPGAGKVYVFLGGDPMNTIPDCWLHGEGATHYLGWWGVATSAAENNYDMVITGTRSYPGGFPGYYPGKVYVLYGGSPMDTIVDLWKVGETDSSWLGNWVDGAQVDSNTMYGDFLAGAPVEYQFDGRGYLWLGNNSIDSIYDAYLQGNIDYSGIGWKVASAGDVNGDGFDEVMFSNYVADSNQTVWVCRYTGQGITEQRAGSIEQSVDIYPNPFRKKIEIKYALSSKHCGEKGKELPTAYSLVPTIRIFDVTGREVMVYEMKDDNRRVAIDTKHLSCGVYFVHFEVGDGSVIKKVVKIE